MGSRTVWLRAAIWTIIGGSSITARVQAERLDFLGPFVNGQPAEVALAGQPFSLLARLSANNDIPLFGYSLNVDVTPKPDVVGTISPNPTASNFFPEQNLIVQEGGTLHPILSIIIAPGDGGLFVNGVNDVPVPVGLSVPGESDILAELVFDTTAETTGTFVFSFGPGTVLSHVPKVEVPFESFSKEVTVILPEPGCLMFILSALALHTARRGRRR